jgi:hypothetical protein
VEDMRLKDDVDIATCPHVGVFLMHDRLIVTVGIGKGRRRPHPASS